MKLGYKLWGLWLGLFGFGGNEEIRPFSFESFEESFGLHNMLIMWYQAVADSIYHYSLKGVV